MRVQRAKVLLAAIGLSGILMYNMPVEASERLMYEYGEGIMPQYEKSFDVQATLNFSGGKAKCLGKVIGKDGIKYSVTVTLQKKTSSGWTNIKTWKGSGQKGCSTSGSEPVSKGSKYRVKVVGKSGTESATSYSDMKSY